MHKKNSRQYFKTIPVNFIKSFFTILQVNMKELNDKQQNIKWLELKKYLILKGNLQNSIKLI
jgi:hypothetical protein